MRSFTRRLAAATAAALFVAGVAVPTASAGLGPAVIDDHDSFIAPRAFELSSSTGGTVFGTDNGAFGHLYLAPAPMTTGTTLVDLGPRPRTQMSATISGSRVAIPQAGASFDTPVTSVHHCLVAACAVRAAMSIPAGWVYIGNADDRAIAFHLATNTLGLVDWAGGAPTNTWVMPVTYSEIPSAVGDATGIAVSGGGEVTYVNRTANTVHYLDYGDGAVLTPTYVVWYAVAVGEPDFDETRIYRVLRSTTEATPAPSIVESINGAPGIEELAANDFGVGWVTPNADADGTSSLWTMPYDGTAVRYARPLTTSALSTFENTSQVLVNDRLAGIPGLYKVTPGSYSGSLTGLVPTRGAVTHSLAVSHSRAMYIDDTTEDLPLFLRSVADGSPGPESLFTPVTGGSVGLSGPYVAFTRNSSVPGSRNLVIGRTDGTLTTRAFAASEVASVSVSGRRALLTGGTRSRVVDIPTGATVDLGRTYAAIFGEYVTTISYDTGAITRRNLDNGAVQVVRTGVPGCTSFCIDEDAWHLAMWGHEVVYTFSHGGTTPGVASGLWNGNTGATTDTAMLTFAGNQLSTEIAYWSGLLLVARNDASVRLYNMRAADPLASEVIVDDFAEEPFAMDGDVVAWRPLTDLKAVVRDVTDFVPGHTPELRYLGGVTPVGFGPGLSPAAWSASFLVTQSMTGSVVIHSGSPSGPVVKTIPVGTVNGELTAVWDGTAADDSDAPQGTYYWTLKTGADVAVPRASGTSAASGSMFLSRTALGAPGLTAPALSTDVSTSASFPVSWMPPSGAPAGTRYLVQRSINGSAFATSTTTTATAMSWGGSPGNTYRFRVAAIDPAGRQGAFSVTRTTIVPFNDNAPGTSYAGTWYTGFSGSLYFGAHRYSRAAGATYTFTATGNTIYLIGSRGPGHGRFQVSIDGGAYSGLIDSYSTSSQVRKVLYSRVGLSTGVHTIRVRVQGTSGRPYVGIDGVAYRR